MNANQTEILVIGAGPTGLTLACLCHRLGLDTRIIDKNSGPSKTSKAIGLQYRVSEILALMGVADRFVKAGGSPTPVNIYHGSRKLVTFNFDLGNRQSGKEAFAPRPILIPQSETERLLGDLLRERGGTIEWNTEWVDFFQDVDSVRSRLRLADGSEEWISSKYLISCEGAHSAVRKQANILFKGKTYPLAFVIADIDIDWQLNHNENHVWMHQDGSFAALPLPSRENQWRLFFEISDKTPSVGEPTLSQIQQLIETRTENSDLKARNPEWLSEFRLSCRMVDRYRSDRVFLAGDAAHIHSPTGGQGITTGVQDAINLGWKLGRVLHGAPSSLLDTYQEERLPKAKEVLSETNRITTVFFAAGGVMRLLRDHLILPVLRMKSVQKRMFGKLSQLHVNYRKSTLSQQDTGWRTSGLRSGDRAPDVVFEFCNSGKRISLFELLQNYRPVVIIGRDPRLEEKEVASLMDALINLDTEAYFLETQTASRSLNSERCIKDLHGDFSEFYGLKQEFLLVIRPDGHIGLIQQPVDMTSLRTYFKKISSGRLVEKEFQNLQDF